MLDLCTEWCGLIRRCDCFFYYRGRNQSKVRLFAYKGFKAQTIEFWLQHPLPPMPRLLVSASPQISGLHVASKPVTLAMLTLEHWDDDPYST